MTICLQDQLDDELSAGETIAADAAQQLGDEVAESKHSSKVLPIIAATSSSPPLLCTRKHLHSPQTSSVIDAFSMSFYH